MALIDVTELFLDPDFVNALSLIHRTPSINSLGEQSLTETLVNTIGVVLPASGKDLMRLPEALRIKSAYVFFLKGAIISDGSTSYPDIIVFNSERYAVQNILDYLNWPAAAGWSQGVAVREVPAL